MLRGGAPRQLPTFLPNKPTAEPTADVFHLPLIWRYGPGAKPLVEAMKSLSGAALGLRTTAPRQQAARRPVVVSSAQWRDQRCSAAGAVAGLARVQFLYLSFFYQLLGILEPGLTGKTARNCFYGPGNGSSASSELFYGKGAIASKGAIVNNRGQDPSGNIPHRVRNRFVSAYVLSINY